MASRRSIPCVECRRRIYFPLGLDASLIEIWACDDCAGIDRGEWRYSPADPRHWWRTKEAP